MLARRDVVVVGHGMVGHRFVEALRARDRDARWRITVLAEESDAAYDRVGLTSYAEHWDRSRMALPGNGYDGDDSVSVVLGDPVTRINRGAKFVTTTTTGLRVPWATRIRFTARPPGEPGDHRRRHRRPVGSLA